MSLLSSRVTFLLIGACLLQALAGCTKMGVDNQSTLKKLYKIYKGGAISECWHNGQQVYSAEFSAFDAGSAIYNRDGMQIGTCSYAWGAVDSICSQLAHCELIYMGEGNIWGRPAVDKYGLGK